MAMEEIVKSAAEVAAPAVENGPQKFEVPGKQGGGVENGPQKFEIPGTNDHATETGRPEPFDANDIRGESVDVQARDTERGKVADEANEVNPPIQNKIDGLRREAEVEKELKVKYPSEEGYTINSEAYLRNKDGDIVKDPVTGERRRIDYAVVKDGKVIDSVEVTSKTADKTEQTAKEDRIRENGGNYIRDENGNLLEIADNVHTRIERRD
jgi:hypothetical protein